MLIACRAIERDQIANGPHQTHANSRARHEGASLRLPTYQAATAAMATIVTVKNKVVSCSLTLELSGGEAVRLERDATRCLRRPEAGAFVPSQRA
jgi:hypothetical protein